MTARPCAVVMLGAMYENGGNTTHRHLDGHPELFVYPYESQIGTRLVNDQWSGMFPAKYRWPVFDLAAGAADDFRAIIDEEAKVRSRTPHVSKFRDWPFDLNDDARRDRFVELTEKYGRTRAGNVLSFFEATFDTWRDVNRSGRERYWVGYSPVLVVDAEAILTELDDAHFVHVVRNPWSAYADTKKRPVPLSLSAYVTQWAINQHVAQVVHERFPERMHIVRFEDLAVDPRAALTPLCRALDIDADAPSLGRPTWNGRNLEQVYPWGTIRVPTTEQNLATGAELTAEERVEVERVAGHWVTALRYADMLS